MIMGCAYIWRIRIRGFFGHDGVRCGGAIPDEVLCAEGGRDGGKGIGIVGIGK